jgi:hypothetical protein
MDGAVITFLEHVREIITPVTAMDGLAAAGAVAEASLYAMLGIIAGAIRFMTHIHLGLPLLTL